MRRHIIMLAAFTALACSCTKEKVDLYDVTLSALNIWAGTENIPVDSITYNYSYTVDKGYIVFYARVSGVPVDHDRTFSLEAVSGNLSEAEGSYELGTYTIPAGEVQMKDTIFFDTSKLKNPSSFTVNDGILVLQMKPNDSFVAGAEELSQLHIILKNYLAKPDEWDSAIFPLMPYVRSFGEYSKVKYQFMIQTLGMRDFHISYTAVTPYDSQTNTISYNYASYLADRMKQALAEYNATHDTPLTDETGALVTF